MANHQWRRSALQCGSSQFSTFQTRGNAHFLWQLQVCSAAVLHQRARNIYHFYLHTLQLLPDIHLPSRLKMTVQAGNHTANNKKREREGWKNQKSLWWCKIDPAAMGLDRSNACSGRQCGARSGWDCAHSSVGRTEIEKMQLL